MHLGAFVQIYIKHYTMLVIQFGDVEMHRTYATCKNISNIQDTLPVTIFSRQKDFSPFYPSFLIRSAQVFE